MTAHVFEVLDSLVGGRLTSLWYTGDRLWPDETDVVVLGQFVRLPSGQHVDVEGDFLSSHLPYRRAGLGGLDPDDEPWLFVVQAGPAGQLRRLFGHNDPYAAMRAAMEAALVYNAGAQVGTEVEWDRAGLVDVYAADGILAEDLRLWTTFELLRGLLAEAVSVPLRDVVAGYPFCAFPDRDHACEHDVFNDVFAAWQRRLLS